MLSDKVVLALASFSILVSGCKSGVSPGKEMPSKPSFTHGKTS